MLALRLPHEALEPLHAQRFGEAFGQRVAVLLCELERRVSDRLGVLAVLEQGHVHLLVCRPHLLPQPRAVAVQQVRAQLRDELCVVDPGLAPHVRDGPASRVEADGRGDRCVEVHHGSTREPGIGGVGETIGQEAATTHECKARSSYSAGAGIRKRHVKKTTLYIYQSPRRRERARFAGFLAAAEEASASPIDAGASSDARRFAAFRPGMSWSTGGAPSAQIWAAAAHASAAESGGDAARAL